MYCRLNVLIKPIVLDEIIAFLIFMRLKLKSKRIHLAYLST